MLSCGKIGIGSGIEIEDVASCSVVERTRSVDEIKGEKRECAHIQEIYLARQRLLCVLAPPVG